MGTDWDVEIIEAEAMPDVADPAFVFGANAPNAGDGPVPRKIARLKADAEKCGLIVTKLMGRWTVLRGEVSVDTGQLKLERTFCFRLSRHHRSKYRSIKAARGEDIDPWEYRCKNAAGQGTLHAGTGGCKYHGGNTYGRHFDNVNGRSNRNSLTRYDVATALLGLDEEGEAYGLLTEFDILDELLVQRQMVNEYLSNECFDADGLVMPEIPGAVIERVMRMTSEITRTVERAKRIENESALTRAHVLYLIDALTTLGKRYVPENKLESFGVDLLSAFGLSLPDPQALPEPRAEDIGRLVEA